MSQGHAISKVCLDTANSILASKDENDPFGKFRILFIYINNIFKK